MTSLDRLACPVCHGKLDDDTDAIRCIGCDRRYAVRDGIPVLKDPSRTTGPDHFDAVSASYDESMPSHVIDHYLDKRAAYIARLLPSGSVLDVGCGTGALLERIGPRYDRAGVDGSVGMLGVLAARCDIPIAAADADLLPFDDDSFDLTFCVAVLHHLERPPVVRGCLEEMWRVTKRGGYVLVWDHNPLNPYWPLLMRRVPQDVGTERLVGIREIRSALEPLGATIWHRRLGFTPDFVPPGAMRAMAATERIAERTPGVRIFGAHNVVLARKN